MQNPQHEAEERPGPKFPGEPPQIVFAAEALVDQIVADAEVPVERPQRNAVVSVRGERHERGLEDVLQRRRVSGFRATATPLRCWFRAHMTNYARCHVNIYIDMYQLK